MTGLPVWVSLVSVIVNALLGGGLLLTLVTLKSYKIKAQGEALQSTARAEVTANEATASEIENVDKVATMWRELSEKLDEKLKSRDKEVELLRESVDKLATEVRRLRAINSRIVNSLDKIDSQNYEAIVTQLKQDIQHADA